MGFHTRYVVFWTYSSFSVLGWTLICGDVEGALTMVASVILFFTFSDFPEEAAWLSQEEKDIVKARLYDDVGPSKRHDKLTLKHVLEVLKDCEYNHSRCCPSKSLM